MLLFLTYDGHSILCPCMGKLVLLFVSTELWLDYYTTKGLIRIVFKVLPVMLALCQEFIIKELLIMLNAFGDLLCSTVNIILA